MNKILGIALLSILSVTCFSQTAPATTPSIPTPAAAAVAADAPVQPQYVILTGGEYDQTSGAAAGLVSFGAKIADKTYSYSTIEMKAARQSSLRTGVARIMTQSQKWTLLALGDAGVTTGSGVALGAFSAGAIAMYDISDKAHVDGLKLWGGVRIEKVSSQSVQPVFEFGVAKSF